MNLKFVLVLLVVLGFAVGSYADCSKDEIMKLLDKGYSKSEVDGICGKNEPKEEKFKWISPTQKACNIGRWYGNYMCMANRSNAKKICRASGGKLPTIAELRKVVINCGGIIDEVINNAKNSVYQDCYKKRGFSSAYWSSTSVESDSSLGWVIGFYNGVDDWYGKESLHYVRCVKEEN